MRSELAANRAIELYADTVRRICFIHLKHNADAEDIFQEVFLKYVQSDIVFEGQAHERAWLIRVAVNACRDMRRNVFRQRVSSIDDLPFEPHYTQSTDRDLLDCVLRLPPRYKDVIYLFYYEGYSAVEIAKILNKKENTIYTWLRRARTVLREQLGGDALG